MPVTSESIHGFVEPSFLLTQREAGPTLVIKKTNVHTREY